MTVSERTIPRHDGNVRGRHEPRRRTTDDVPALLAAFFNAEVGERVHDNGEFRDGHSSGAGLAAGAAILARDRAVPVARQILLYPMLDDRTVEPDPHLVSMASWTYENNRVGWTGLLGGRPAGPVEAPARLADAAGLPPAYIEVGELDIFRDECVAYASKLWRTGVSTELHVHQGLVHGFDHVMTQADFTRRAIANRIRFLQQL
jgi:acetyl esterase/lipase